MLSDVIAALASAPGRGPIALIRVSGQGSHALVSGVLVPYTDRADRRVRRARVIHPRTGETLDEVLYVQFAGPASYTGEDMVEISTHGGVLTPAEVLGALFEVGARPAVAGEFTRRAVLNGKLDLLQAEAIGDLIDATAPAQRQAALVQLDRGLTARIEDLRTRILELEALISYEIDFPEEDDGPVSPGRVGDATANVREQFAALVRSADAGERLRAGALVVIAGKPNVGKSSLFNALVGSERVIVTEMPGTTRDAVEAPVSCGGYPFRLVDTAGLHETDDCVERMGIEVSRRYLDRADLVLFCVDAGREFDSAEVRFIEGLGDRVLVVRTKSDLHSNDPPVGIEVSALQGTGIDTVRDAMARRAFTDTGSGSTEAGVTRERHRVALSRGLSELDAFADARAAGLEGAVAAVHLRSAVLAVEDVIGVVTTEDVLDRVFASFCIGK